MDPSDAFPARLAEALGQESAYAFSKRSGVSQSLLSKYLRGDSLPRIDRAAEIAAEVGVSLDWLVGFDTDAGGDGALAAPEFAGIPIVSSVPSGPMQLFDVMEHPDETVPIDAASLAPRGDRLFGLRVDPQTDSMEPWIYGGDIVVCSTVQSVEVGDDVVLFQYHSGESTIKRLTALNRPKRYVQLMPMNPRYDPFRVDLSEGDSIHKVLLTVRVASRRKNRQPP